MKDSDGKTYWALKPAKDLIPELCKRRKEFLELFDSTGLFDRVKVIYDLYHGNKDGFRGSSGINLAGPDGDLLDVNFNAFRSSLSLLKTYITSAKVEWDAITSVTAASALLTAKQANTTLDTVLGDPSTGLEHALSQAVEDALVLTAGYLWVQYDYTLGTDLVADPQEGIIYKSGSLKFRNPSVLDVAFDPFSRDVKEARWLDCRYAENRWDLAAEFPKQRAKILEIPSFDKDTVKYDLSLDQDQKQDRDFVWCHYFLLRPSPAAPTGRYVRYLPGPDPVVLEENESLPYGCFTVHRIVPSQFLLTPFGFTPAFSAEAPQQLLDNVLSSIATNQDALGTNKVWKKPGEPISRAQLEPGVTLIESETKPENVDLLKTPPELFKSIEVYLSFIERLTGVNAAAHGQPQGDRTSGSALAFTEQRAAQAASDLVSAYDIFLAEVGTTIIKILRAQARPPKGINPADFTPPFGDIDRVAIVKGNPLMRGMSGRAQLGEVLLQGGHVDMDEFLTLVLTGSVQKLTESRDRQLDLIHAENDAFLRGEMTHIALPTDDHVKHLKHHNNLVALPQVRNNPALLQAIAAASLQHKQLMMDPEVQLFQSLLYGTQMPAPPGAPPPGGGGSPPKEPGQPSPPKIEGNTQPQLRGGAPSPPSPQ